MRAELSVVIPTLNAASTLPGCLAALFEGLEAGLIRELVISDGGSSDTTRAIADAAGAIWIEGAASRGGQLRRGAEAAGGAWLLFVHADTQLSPGWSKTARIAIQQGNPGYFRLRFDARGLAPRLVALWANLRSALFALPYGDQGLLISRDEYDAVGGVPDIPLMEDVAMARVLGRRLRRLDGIALTDAEKYRRDGWLRRGSRNLCTLCRYFCGADPERLRRNY